MNCRASFGVVIAITIHLFCIDKLAAVEPTDVKQLLDYNLLKKQFQDGYTVEGPQTPAQYYAIHLQPKGEFRYEAKVCQTAMGQFVETQFARLVKWSNATGLQEARISTEITSLKMANVPKSMAPKFETKGFVTQQLALGTGRLQRQTVSEDYITKMSILGMEEVIIDSSSKFNENIVNDLIVPFEFPDHPLKIGDTWSYTVFAQKIECKIISMGQLRGDKVAEIERTGNFTMDLLSGLSGQVTTGSATKETIPFVDRSLVRLDNALPLRVISKSGAEGNTFSGLSTLVLELQNKPQ